MRLEQNQQRDRTSAPGRVPWLVFIFLTAVFLMAFHSLTYAQQVFGPEDSSSGDVLKNEMSADVLASQLSGSFAKEIALVSLGMFAVATLIRFRANRSLLIQGALAWILLGYIGWASCSTLWADDLPLSLKRLMVLWILCIAAAAIVWRLSLPEIVSWVVFCTGVCLFIGIIASVIYGTFRPWSSGYRFAGILYPNGEGVECAILMLSAVAAGDIHRRWRSFFRAIAFVGFVFLILSGSRTALSVSLFALLVYVARVSSRAQKWAAVCGLGLVACVLSLSLATGPASDLTGALLLGRDAPGSVDTFAGRTLVWKEVVKYIAARPITGYGYGGFWTVKRISMVSEDQEWLVPDSHSAYIDNLLGLGAVGFILYCLSLIAGSWRVFSVTRLTQRPEFAYCMAVLVFCILQGFLESDMYVGSFLMFLCMVILCRFAFVPVSSDWKIAAADLMPATTL